MSDLVVVETPRRKRKKAPRTKGKLKSISRLIRECDDAMSRNVRMIGAWEVDGVWYNKCYTHDVEQYRVMPIKKLQCGHYLTRWYKAARWDYDNCRPQCYVCNMRKKGMSVEFRANLIKEIGVERVEAVEAKRRISVTLTREYLENLLVKLSTDS